MTDVTTANPVRPQCVPEIEREIGRLLEARAGRASAYGARFASLWSTATDCVLGGKLLRPRMLMGAFDALAEVEARTAPPQEAAPRDAALRIAAGVELLHFSFILHDDVIDEDLFRRGRPNLIGAVLRELDPEPLDADARPTRPAESGDLHWARTSGILMGDLMLSAAHQVFAREALPPVARSRLLDLLDRTITETVAGEQLDVGLSDGIVPSDLTTVLAMSRLKTTTYTFELPLRAAAILSGVSRETEEAIGEIGGHLGTAFQLQDDLLSTFGDAAEHGKDAFSDLREGKETAIIAYARMTDGWPSIAARFGRAGLSDADGRAMRALLVDGGAECFVRSLIEDRLRSCFDLLSSPEIRIPAELARFFGGLVESLGERTS